MSGATLAILLVITVAAFLLLVYLYRRGGR
jgi:hypothetical protein